MVAAEADSGMAARIMRTRDGTRFLIVEYDGTRNDWEAAICAAHRRFGNGVDTLPVIAVRSGSAFGCHIIGAAAAEQKQAGLFDSDPGAR
jgi:hypothetical protein